MEEKWRIVFYQTTQGDSPVKDFIDGLDLKAQSKIGDALNLLRNFGIKLGLPHAKKLTGTKLWELRIVGEDSIRILYIAVTGRNFLILHGFKKKKNKTPPREIRLAEVRLFELRSRIGK